MNEEQINAARAAFQRDPETACQALLGCSAEEMFITALRGCNQHKHKPGCPDAEGGGGGGVPGIISTAKTMRSAYIPSPPRDQNQMSDLQVFLLSEMHNKNVSKDQVAEYERRFKEEVKRLNGGNNKAEPSPLDSYEKEQVRRLRELRQLEKTRWENYMKNPKGGSSYLDGEIGRLNREYKEAMEKRK